MLRAAALGTEHVALARRRRQQRIAPQLGVIVEILITQRQPVEPLCEQLADLVLDQILPAPIHKTTRQPSAQSEARIDLAQEQRPAIAAEPATGKICHHFARTEVLKKQRLAETLCLTGVGGWVGCKFFHTNYNHSPLTSVASVV
jgi:hypothetical protein